jgi:hypothetical protein
MGNPGSVIEIAAIIFAIRFLAVEAKHARASRRGEALVFAPVLGLRLLFGFPIVGLLYLSAETVKNGPRNDLALVPVGIGVAVVFFLLIPGTILVSKTSIDESRWLGLKRTHIPWEDVVYAGGDLEDRVTVRSKNDHVISHTAYHVDRDGFIEGLKKYCPQCSYNQRADGPQPGPWVPLGSS